MVYSLISPPTIFFRPAKISLPIFLALTVLPRATPNICSISFPGMFSVVVVIRVAPLPFLDLRLHLGLLLRVEGVGILCLHLLVHEGVLSLI